MVKFTEELLKETKGTGQESGGLGRAHSHSGPPKNGATCFLSLAFSLFLWPKRGPCPDFLESGTNRMSLLSLGPDRSGGNSCPTLLFTKQLMVFVFFGQSFTLSMNYIGFPGGSQW